MTETERYDGGGGIWWRSGDVVELEECEGDGDVMKVRGYGKSAIHVTYLYSNR